MSPVSLSLYWTPVTQPFSSSKLVTVPSSNLTLGGDITQLETSLPKAWFLNIHKLKHSSAISEAWHTVHHMTRLTSAQPWQPSVAPWWSGHDGKLVRTERFPSPEDKESPPPSGCPCHGSHSRWPGGRPVLPPNLQPNTKQADFFPNMFKYEQTFYSLAALVSCGWRSRYFGFERK